MNLLIAGIRQEWKKGSKALALLIYLVSAVIPFVFVSSAALLALWLWSLGAFAVLPALFVLGLAGVFRAIVE